MPRVTALNIYPIKSCRGIRVEEALVEPRGLAGDRRFMLIDENARFVTQRQHPKMALLHVSLRGGTVFVDAGTTGSLEFPSTPGFADRERVKIWRGALEASIADAPINDWFSDFMGFECRLAYMADDQHRAVPHPSARFEDEVSFADGAPLLLISEASLGALNSRLAMPVTMDRFRPNVVVCGTEAFAEDSWRGIGIGEATFEVAWSCSRCLMTTVDPETGERDPDGEPLETLKTFRQDKARVMFGQNVIPRQLGRIRVGDAVTVLQE